MSGTTVERTNSRRRVYARPVVKRVHLKPEEAVLGFCKIAGGGGPNIGGNCNSPSNCSGLGS